MQKRCAGAEKTENKEPESRIILLSGFKELCGGCTHEIRQTACSGKGIAVLSRRDAIHFFKIADVYGTVGISYPLGNVPDADAGILQKLFGSLQPDTVEINLKIFPGLFLEVS